MPLKIIPLGGLGEIGLNMMVYEYDDVIFIVDSGLMFPEDYMLGVDYVIPDMEYIRTNKAKVHAIILTHAHEDHIGALPFLLKEVQVPVYATAFTLGIVRNKLEEHDILATTDLYEISPRDTLRIGPFELEFIRVCHSVVDGVGLAVKTPVGTIIHTGDFKIDHTAQDDLKTDVGRFAQWGETGILALLSDSTNVEKEGYTISAKQIGDSLARLAENCSGRIIVALFASNITRIQKVVNIAVGLGRKVVFNGRSIELSVRIAKELGFLKIPTDMEVEIDDIDDLLDSEIVMIMTGSQGEPMSALARMAAGTHKQITIKPEDTILLSSKFIPGNEKAITNIINNLYRRGADVIYEKISAIHVSGHAFQEELKLMINLVKPRYFIPIHGEFRHLTLHSRLAQQVGIPKKRVVVAQNGNVIEFAKYGISINEVIPTGKVLVDGKGIGDVGRSVLKERHSLSKEGLVVVNMAFDEETGIIVYGPEIVSRGFVFETETGHLLRDAECVVLESVEEIGPEVANRIDKIRHEVRRNLRQYFFYAIGRRPVILPFFTEI
ncbi:MAG: ribonuclease J [Deltaproteobacteria bacterium]|jgi:ribonuclease J|nr:ribonuclease J [Deltaproteobacteria bacterium]